MRKGCSKFPQQSIAAWDCRTPKMLRVGWFGDNGVYAEKDFGALAAAKRARGLCFSGRMMLLGRRAGGETAVVVYKTFRFQGGLVRANFSVRLVDDASIFIKNP